jgi:hypothetical protein
MTRPKALQMTSQLPWWFSSRVMSGALLPSGIPFDNVAMLYCELCSRCGYNNGDKGTLCDQEVGMRGLNTQTPLYRAFRYSRTRNRAVGLRNKLPSLQFPASGSFGRSRVSSTRVGCDEGLMWTIQSCSDPAKRNGVNGHHAPRTQTRSRRFSPRGLPKASGRCGGMSAGPELGACDERRIRIFASLRHWNLYARVQSELGLSQTATAIAITCQHGRKIRRIPPSITLQGTTLADCVQRTRLMRRSFDDCCALLHTYLRAHTVGTAQLRVRDAYMHR